VILRCQKQIYYWGSVSMFASPQLSISIEKKYYNNNNNNKNINLNIEKNGKHRKIFLD